MFSSSTVVPQTPSSSRFYQPSASSPLSASASSPLSSPTSHATTRRSQYKSITPQAGPSSTARRPSTAYAKRSSSSAWDGTFMRSNLFGTEPEGEDPARRSLLRERFKQRCFERAQRAREHKIRTGRKHSKYTSSEGEDMEMDEDDDDDDFLDDTYFARVMQSVQRRQEHQYKLSYQQDVGSSFDPDMEDVGEWERDLSVHSDDPRPPSEYEEEELEELAKLAEDEAYWEALGDTSFLDNINIEALPGDDTAGRGPAMDMDTT